jgi:8-oxo-dGTP pyrophosphatase MutT (NUDIX family)/GNAT superfamily N-acetyltransferase
LPREFPAAPAILTPIRLDPRGDTFPVGMGETPNAFRRGRPAAVLVLLYPDHEGQARVLLTARVPQLSSHAGEVSFPGGSADPGDTDPVATALREASEEVGLDPAACGLRVTGGLEVFALTVSGYRITPVVALAERRPECRPAPLEVARIIEAPVEAFLPEAPVELEERTIRERLIRYGVYPVDGERVWGATARMLGQLGALLAGSPIPLERESPVPTTDRANGDATIRTAVASDGPAVTEFLDALAPELAHARPPASGVLLAEADGRIAGVASWAPWDRPRPAVDPRGFDSLSLPDGGRPAELTLLAVAPDFRSRGVGRGLTNAVAAAASAAGSARLLVWTLGDAAIHPSSVAARTFLRGNGFTDLAVDRGIQARGEDRLLLSRALG